MGALQNYTAIAGKISRLPNLTEEQVREQLNLYITDMLSPPISEEELLMMIERNPAVRGQERHLPRYTGEERDKRRTLSETVRRGLIESLSWPLRRSEKYMSNGAEVAREEYALFYYEAPGQTDPRNREVLWLVDRNPVNRPTYIEELKQRLMGAGKTAEAAQQEAEAYFTEDALRIRRSKLVMDRVKECTEMIPRLGEMTSAQRTAAELAQNYIAMIQARDIFMELDRFIGQATNVSGYLQLQRDQIDFLREHQNDQISLGEATLPLENIANPLYEIVDPEAIVDSNTSALLSLEMSLQHGTRGQAQKRQFLERDPNYSSITEGVLGNLQALITDGMSIRNHIHKRADEREQKKMEEVYGFIPKDTVQVIEPNRGYTMFRTTETAVGAGKPVAYELGSRVVILTAAGTNSHPTVSTENPDALFNHTLEQKNREIYELLDGTDKWYKGSSPEYRAMSSALAKVCKVKPLGKHRTADKQKELDTAQRRFETLLTTTKAYLKKKPDKSDNPYENKRIQAAKQVREYAETKLRELELVEKARRTLKRFRGMSEEQIRAETARENAELGHMREMDARREDTAGWLGRLNDRYRKQRLPDSITNQFASAVDELRGFKQEDGIFVGKNSGKSLEEDPRPISSLIGYIKLLTGYSVACELILRERKNREELGLEGTGPLESAFCSGKASQRKKLVQALGEQVIEVGLQLPLEQLDYKDLSQFLASFEIGMMADRVEKKFSFRCGVPLVNEAEQMFSRKFADRPAVHTFIDRAVYAPAKALQAKMLNGETSVGLDEASRMVSGCVLATMLQAEWDTSEKLRQLIHDESSTEKLLSLIQESEPFQKLNARFDLGDSKGGIAEIQDMLYNATHIAEAWPIQDNEQFQQAVDALYVEQQAAAQAKSNEFRDAVIDQYGKPPFTEAPLEEFVSDNIVNSALAYQSKIACLQTEVEFETGYRMMSSCVLAQLVQLEQNPDGLLHGMMKSREGINTALGLVEGSKPFQEMTADLFRMGDRPDIREIPKLIQNRQPQHTALQILTDARFKQMLDVASEQRKAVLEHNGPQNNNAQPQAGGHH